MVHHEEVPAVEEGVTFGQDVSQDLLLCLLGIARVAVEGGVLGDFDDQQPRLTFGEGEEGWGQSAKCLGAGECHLRAPPGAWGCCRFPWCFSGATKTMVIKTKSWL